jgi:uncharacterized FAD-dependent dehydrogenase
MAQIKEVVLPPEEAFDPQVMERALARELKVEPAAWQVRALKRSVDARGKKILVKFQVEVHRKPEVPPLITYQRAVRSVQQAPPILVVGAGPAGLFAALRLMELGFKPIVLDRGGNVQERRRDLAAINKHQIVNPESNYCFGEGGAGTYSDGKLYTRSKKRGDVKRILEILVAHGATEEILFDAHPHIGTNKLPKLVMELRETILAGGGEIHFHTKVTDLLIAFGEVKGVRLQSGAELTAEAVILATGHSARDIFQLLHDRKIHIEAKPFALGVRVEHAQATIDRIQYHCATDRGPYLPASSYALVHQAHIAGADRGVFSFCMCPGGFIVPAATAPGEIVVNGMSPSRRDSRFANSGIVVAVELGDYKLYEKWGPLSGLHFQAAIERQACAVGGGTQVAPAQRLVDFVEKRVSASLLDTSYQPGLQSADLREVLPPFLSDALRQGFIAFGKKMKGYLTNEAQIVGVESRSSSPVKIPRDPQTLEHVQIKRLFPCGEGAGYAGGIVSAAMDGERCAEAVAAKYAMQTVSSL